MLDDMKFCAFGAGIQGDSSGVIHVWISIARWKCYGWRMNSMGDCVELGLIAFFVMLPIFLIISNSIARLNVWVTRKFLCATDDASVGLVQERW